MTSPWGPPGSPLPAPGAQNPLPPHLAPPPPAAPPRRHRLRTALIVGGCVAVLGAVGIWAIGRRGSDGADHPDEWDPRVADLVSFVEGELDGDFEHPVTVRFLRPDEFDQLVQTDEDELTDEDEQAARDTEALGRALGLFSGETDVLGESNDLAGSGILAYYSDDDQEIVAQVDDPEADELPVDLQVTLVHELTHAWQDQRYDLDAVQGRAKTQTQSDAILGLIEGHAVWVEDRYIDQLSDEDAADYDETQADLDEQYTEDTQGITPALEAAQAAPYILGPTFVAALIEDDPDLIDEAFGDRPLKAEDQLVLPSGYLDDDRPEDLEDPEVPDESEEVDRGQMGMPATYLMLSGALPVTESLTAADGWGNDAYVTYEQDDRVCVRLAVVGDDADATDRLANAFDTWAAAAPAESDAEVDVTDGVILVTTCDPGPDIERDVPGEDEIVQLFSRAGDLRSLVDEGFDLDVAECIATRFYSTYVVAELTDVNDLPQDEINAIFDECDG